MSKLLATFACLAFLAGAPQSFGQASVEFAELIARTQNRIEATLQEYRTFLQETENERLDLVSQVNLLENEIVKLKQSELSARKSETEGKFQLEDLQERIKAIDTQTQYSSGVLTEYLTNFESRIHVSEDQAYLTPLKELREKLDQADEETADRLPLLFKALELGFDRQEALIGGTKFKGRAITPTGGVKSGTIALIGPVAFFSDDANTVAGPISFNSGTIEPGLTNISPEDAQELHKIMGQNSGFLPLDSSLGNALVLKQAKGSIPEHIAKGGWVGYAIILLGGLAILVALFKLIDLRGMRINEPRDLSALAVATVEESVADAKAKIANLKGPIAKVLEMGIEFSMTDTDTQLDAMESAILRYRPRLERFLPILATTAAVAPLMGLLGTVVGMIKTFTLIEVFGTGDAKSLSSGISEALVTTELGLIVAIPALIFHGVFTRIMRSRLGSMEQIATDFSRQVFAAKQKESYK